MTAERTVQAFGSDERGTQEALRRAREQLMSGRGPGASPEEVAAAGRRKAVQAGVPALHRLAATARDTALARGAPGAAIEAVHVMQVSPAGVPLARPRASQAAWIATGVAAAMGVVALVRAVRR